MEKLLISSCLLGLACRYDGREGKKIDLEALSDQYTIVPFCPEIYGGLPTPRVPSEIIDDKVMMKDGTDVTENYRKGATEALRLCRMLGIEKALLKEKSPSCGSGRVYDGSFSGTLIDGDGITAALLKANGITVYGESEIEKLLKKY